MLVEKNWVILTVGLTTDLVAAALIAVEIAAADDRSLFTQR
jgi:hypothetical protein